MGQVLCVLCSMTTQAGAQSAGNRALQGVFVSTFTIKLPVRHAECAVIDDSDVAGNIMR